MTNTLYADIDKLQTDIRLLRGGIYCKVKVEELEAEVLRLHKGWTKANILLTNAETRIAELEESVAYWEMKLTKTTVEDEKEKK
jgi:hypothetical protein